MKKNKRGISLIVLIITIIVMLILVSVVVVSFNNNNPIGKAKEAKFKSDLSSFRDELEDNINDILIKNANKSEYDINVDSGDYGNLRIYIPDITEEYANKLLIKKGKLLYIGDDSKADYEKYHDDTEEAWAKSVGIQCPYSQVGDADGDGYITEEDKIFIEKYAANIIKVDQLTDRKKNAMDAYKNGVISVEDGTAVGKYLKLGISLPEMPTEKN
ncbi:MAG: hypothetical protein KBI16_00690 [Clostridia bacterium]|jgi:hypothetical protein|nr:hypothetical protein [Clostridia bacterium]